LAVEIGVREQTDIVGRPALEREAVGEEDLGYHPLAFHVLQPQVRIPLSRGVEAGTQPSVFRCPGRFLRLRPFVEDTQIGLLDVVPVVAP